VWFGGSLVGGNAMPSRANFDFLPSASICLEYTPSRSQDEWASIVGGEHHTSNFEPSRNSNSACISPTSSTGEPSYTPHHLHRNLNSYALIERHIFLTTHRKTRDQRVHPLHPRVSMCVHASSFRLTIILREASRTPYPQGQNLPF
jgi:hypothetical protein